MRVAATRTASRNSHRTGPGSSSLSNHVVPGFASDFKEIYEMDSDGSNLVQITSSARFGGLDWGAV